MLIVCSDVMDLAPLFSPSFYFSDRSLVPSAPPEDWEYTSYIPPRVDSSNEDFPRLQAFSQILNVVMRGEFCLAHTFGCAVRLDSSPTEKVLLWSLSQSSIFFEHLPSRRIPDTHLKGWADLFLIPRVKQQEFGQTNAPTRSMIFHQTTSKRIQQTTVTISNNIALQLYLFCEAVYCILRMNSNVRWLLWNDVHGLLVRGLLSYLMSFGG